MDSDLRWNDHGKVAASWILFQTGMTPVALWRYPFIVFVLNALQYRRLPCLVIPA